MKNIRVLALVPEGAIPPKSIKGLEEKEIAPWKMEYHVISTLERLGHEVQTVDVGSNLGVVRDAIIKWDPHISFNMLEDFHGVAVYDQHVVSYLELMKKPYTGCNPRGLMLAHDKALAKKLLSYHRIRTPAFAEFPMGKAIRKPRNLSFPLLVKSTIEESSMGISQASLVKNEEQLIARVQFIHKQIQTDAIAEEYIEGRELYVGILGNSRLRTLPTWELLFTKMPEEAAKIATAKVKWDLEYQKKRGIDSNLAGNLPEGLAEKISTLCRRVYRTLNLSGYARIDLRLDEKGMVYVIEANPNPDLSKDEDFALSAKAAGISYRQLIQRIINLGLEYRAEWKINEQPS